MIELYTGLIGGGKTYSAVERIRNYLLAGGLLCITNIKINIDELGKQLLRAGLTVDVNKVLKCVDNDAILKYEDHPRGISEELSVLIVIDEGSEILDAQDWKKSDSRFMSFLRQSRKFFQDIIIIVQHEAMINKRVRMLSAFIWYFRDMSKYKVPVLGIKWPFGSQIVQFRYDRLSKVCLGKYWKAKDKRIFALYDTTQVFRDFGNPASFTTAYIRFNSG